MTRSFGAGLTAFVLICLAGAAAAQPGSAPSWQELSATQRAALAPLQRQWPEIDEARRQSWIEVAARLPQLPPDERQRLQARMAAWARMSPDERGHARLQFQQAQRWTPQERQQRWEAYQSLHPQARAVLAERWKLEAPSAQGAARHADAKRNIVEPPAAPIAPPKLASPTSVRAREGATTQPLVQGAASAGDRPVHHQPGLPKIVATDSFVDPATLLPRRGPQGAAVAAPAPAASR